VILWTVISGVSFLVSNAIGYAITPDNPNKEGKDKIYKVCQSIGLAIAFLGLAI